VKALLLLDNDPVHNSTDLLRSKHGKIKRLFLPPNTSSLIQPMDQGVILTCKQLDECFVFFKSEDEGIFDDDIGEKKRGQKEH
jgi:hypothetical protein